MMKAAQIFIAWKNEPDVSRKGTLSIRNGRICKIAVVSGEAVVKGASVEQTASAPLVLQLDVELSEVAYGVSTPILKWEAGDNSFSLLPLTIPAEGCMEVPDLGVMIGRDRQAVQASHGSSISYEEVLQRNGYPKGRDITWDAWAEYNNSNEEVPTVLGLSRDDRVFIVDYSQNKVFVRTGLARLEHFFYTLNRTRMPNGRVVRSLEEDQLPILHGQQEYENLVSEDTLFATFIDRPLTEKNLTGTPIKFAHYYDNGSTFPPGMKEEVEKELSTYRHDGELVLFLRTKMTNRSDIPIVASHRFPTASLAGGVRTIDQDGVIWVGDLPISMHRVDGASASSMQPGVILPPGETITFDSVLSHGGEGLSERARQGDILWDEKFQEAKVFWQGKLNRSASVKLPEKRLVDFWNIGLLDLDLITFGLNHEGALLPKVGIYSPIGSESIPIVEFYDSVGWHDIARRSIDCFFELQWKNGRINLFAHYDIETGGVLFLSGRHYAYTQDKEWVRQHVSHIKRAADYILNQRQVADPHADQYGLVSGTVADPVEKTTAFMLNAYNAAGIAATATLLEAIGDPDAERYRKIADEFVAVYRKAFIASFGRGPLIPTAPGRWAPSGSSNVETWGLSMLGLKGEALYTHWSYTAFDVLVGPMYGVFAGLIDPDEIQTQWLLEINSAQLNRACIAESQPYYSRHPELHLLRDEREPFLNAFYSGITALADRDTLSFWEHLYHCSLHKTHEEGWALMQLRRMLWLEYGDELRLLPGIPEAWLDTGEEIAVRRVGSYFGDFSFRLKRSSDGDFIDFEWEPDFHTSPRSLILYLPGLGARVAPSTSYQLESKDRVSIPQPSQSTTLRIPIDSTVGGK